MSIKLLDNTHQYFTTSFVVVGVWPTNVGDLALEYKADDSSVMTASVKFKYQYCYRDDTLDYSNDPLKA